MSVNTCLIYRCLSSASAVIRSWFIYELQKSTTIAFSRNSLYTFYSRNPTCGIPPCLRISNRKYPPCPQNSIIVNPPSPSEILEAVRGMVWIFSGIAHSGKNLAIKTELCYIMGSAPYCNWFFILIDVYLILKPKTLTMKQHYHYN